MSDEASELSDDEDAEQFAGDRDGILPPLEPNQILRLVERTAALGLESDTSSLNSAKWFYPQTAVRALSRGAATPKTTLRALRSR